ncbi:MAG TPA: hypothetical protein VIL74_20820 [Pyrinomonadaceae bacterium]|jgi:hypothetical protein
MTQQLAIRENNQLAPSASEFAVMKEQASMLIKSNFLPQAIKTPEQAVAIILTGRELGIGTMQALNTINVISGKPTVSPQLMLALIERSGQLENIVVKTHNSPDGTVAQVSCTMKRKGRTEHTEFFGTKEANALGLLSKDNYRKQPAVMFRWRAVAACARVVFPDVILGIYTFEEMGAEVSIGDNDELTMMPAEETSKPIVVKMPQKPVEPEAIQAEPVFEEPQQSRTDELQRQREQNKAVTPETKGRLLAEGGFVARNNLGYEVTDTEDAEIYQITQVTELGNKVIKCTCANYVDSYNHGAPHWRCAHIHALSFHHQLQRQAA